MKTRTETDPFALVWQNETKAWEFDPEQQALVVRLDTDDIIIRLGLLWKRWPFRVVKATSGNLQIEFARLPSDLDAFVTALYDFCPEAIDGGAGVVARYIRFMKQEGHRLPLRFQELIEDLDLNDPAFPYEIFKRELRRDKKVCLWWEPRMRPKRPTPRSR